jgi:hypothetical protein
MGWAEGIPAADDPKSTPLGCYFENYCDIAGEEIEGGTPPLILAEYAAHLALVFNACLLGSFPTAVRKKLEASPVYRFAVRLPLQISFRLVLLWLREPRTVALILTTTLVASLVA